MSKSVYEAFEEPYLLVIDDDELIWVLIRDVLRHLGLLKGLKTFPEAELALDFLRQTPQAPEIMVVDLQLPGMDGFAFLEQFGKELRPRCLDTQIHVVSGSINPEDHQRASANPMIVSFVAKPLKLEHLRQMLTLRPSASLAV